MGITILKGLSAKVVQGESAGQNQSHSQAPPGAYSSVAVNPLASEAAVLSFRSSGGSSGSDKLRTSDEAKGVADTVADKIRKEEEGGEAHADLSTTSAHFHFAE